MSSANQYLRYINQTEGRIEKITVLIKTLKDSKVGSPKDKAQKITAKIKLQQEELKSAKEKLKEHKANLKEAKTSLPKPVAKKVKSPKAKGASPKVTTTSSSKSTKIPKATSAKSESNDGESDNALSPFETQLLNAVTALATKVKGLEERIAILEATSEKVSDVSSITSEID